MIVMVLMLAVGIGTAVSGTISGTVTCKGLRSNADAVVYIDAIEGVSFDPPAESVLMDQVAMEFVPHVLAVQVGTSVAFRNSDPVLHNVFSPDKCADKFNLGSWPQGEKRSYVFAQTCAAVVLCNVHPEMEGFVFAAPTPYFAVTDKDGAFEIADVPEGEYTIRIWHPKMKEGSAEVTVGAEGVTIEMELKH